MVRWQGRRGSRNVADRRGSGAGGAILAHLLPLLFSRFGLVGVVVAALAFFGLRAVGVDPLALLSGGADRRGANSSGQEEMVQFVSVILAETEDAWSQEFSRRGESYPAPRLNLFSGQISSACGFAAAAVGPFYCPADREIYLDLSFFDDLARRFGAPGDFAAAYVIAHEVGHHVQTVTGTARQFQQAEADAATRNQLSVRQELQADCYAGIWAHHADRTAGILEPGDIDEGLRAAAAIGDDTLQRNAGQKVQPESFTHGTAEQRARWFQVGYRSGDPADCDTARARSL